MNSNYGKSNTKSGFDFDLGLNKSSSQSLNDQKNKTSSYSSASSYSSYSSAQTKPSTTPSWTTHQPNKPSWTHQPAGSLSGPTSMVGDIFGKSWGSSAPAPAPAGSMNSGIGVVKKDPNLFGDLLSSALGQNKGSSNVPLKNAAPVSNKSSFSMGSMADSLPKTGSSAKSGGNWGSAESFGSFTSGFSDNNSGTGNVNLNGNASKGAKFGGPSVKSMAGSGGQGGMSSKKDPFGSLVDFSSKSSGTMNSGSKGSSKSSVGDDAFGSFQNASKTSGTTFSSSGFTSANINSMGSSAAGSYSAMDDFGFSSSQTQNQPSTYNNNSMGSGAGGSYSNMDDFGFPNSQPQSQPSVQSTGVNDFDTLFSSTTGSSGETAMGNTGFESQQFSGGDDWGLDSEFGGGHDTGGTTELEGLPPPPAGVSAATAKNKGLDNYKQGQYADAIKWLSWAVILLEKSGDDAGTMEVLTCRASCYKEVGEYKKAVADCTKALEQDDKNVTILVQRALLYESMEKYKLGAEDLRTVMKIDPGNRVARSTIHRLTKMAE